MRKETSKTDHEALLALVLLGVFAVCVLTVLLTGASAYRRLVDRDQEAYRSRTAAQYIATKVRQSDSADNIALAAFGDGDALVLDAQSGYTTTLYCLDGYLMELYTDPSLGLGPADGERVLELAGLELSLEDGLLDVTCTDQAGGVEALTLFLRSGEEGTP